MLARILLWIKLLFWPRFRVLDTPGSYVVRCPGEYLSIGWSGDQPVEIVVYEMLADHQKRVKHIKSQRGLKSIEIRAPFAVIEIAGQGRIEAKG